MKKLALALLAILLVAGAGVSITHQRESLRQKRELSDLKEAYLALVMYKSDHGQFPRRLVDLIPKYLTEETHQRVAAHHYSPETPDRLLVRAGTIVKSDGSAQVDATQ